MHPLVLVTILMSLIPLQMLIGYLYPADPSDQAKSTKQYQDTLDYVTTQLLDTVYFMSDVHNWRYLLMAPKRRDYGEAGRRGRKDDPMWNLLKDGGTEELKNSAAQIISKLLLGDDANENGQDYTSRTVEEDKNTNQIQSLTDKDYFARSNNPRDPRPAHVRYRVGQVIQHRIHGYRGVIIGWDPICKAPEAWIKKNHPSNKPEWRKRANYAVLVDIRDRPEPQITYVAEDNILLVDDDTEVIHPSIVQYFEDYEDNEEYVPQDWLSRIYPDD